MMPRFGFSGPDSRRGALRWLTLAASILILLPLAFTDVPPIGDYANHLARIAILRAIPADPILSGFYEPSLKLVPNLAFDLVVWPLSFVVGIHAAGKFFIALTLLAGLWGALCYHRAMSGRVSLWPLIVSLFAFNQYLLAGFMNFTLGFGLALGCAGLSWQLRDRSASVRLPVLALFASGLYLVHMTAPAFFILLLGLQELGQVIADKNRSARRVAIRALGVLLALSPPFLLMAFASPDNPSHAVTAATTGAGVSADSVGIRQRVQDFVQMASVGRIIWLNFATIGFAGGVIACAVLRRRVTLSWPPLIAAALFLAVFIATAGIPVLFQNPLPHLRFPGPVLLLTLLAFDIAPLGRFRMPALAAGGLLLVAQTATTAADFRAYEADTAEMRAAYAAVPPGSKVVSFKPDALPGTLAREAPARHFYFRNLLVLHQYQMLAAAEQRVFVPNNFAHPVKHILQVRAPYRALAYDDGGVPTPWSQAQETRSDPKANPAFFDTPIWQPSRDWPHRFDYVSVLYPDFIPGLKDGDTGLEEVYRGRWIAMYRVKKPTQP